MDNHNHTKNTSHDTPTTQVHAENPEELLKLRLHKPSISAAGITGVKVAVQHVLKEMSIARGAKALFALNQKGGFDCPSCAWPDPDDERSPIGEYCENGAKAVADEATTKRLTASFFAKNSVADLSLLNDYEIGKKGRIAEPVYLAAGASHYTPISWDEAFGKIATHLNKLKSPDEAVFYTSGRTSNEAAFLYQLFVREYGTNNLPDCSNMCHESSGLALDESVGIGKGSVKLEDFYKAEAILIIGQNPGTNHPRMLSALQKAKECGATIISINPLPETGLIAFSDPQSVKGALGIKSRLTDIFLQVKLNGDMALIQAIEKLLLAEEEKAPGTVLDQNFIANNTQGFDAWKQNIEAQSLENLIEQTGLRQWQIDETVAALKDKTKIIACWAMGLTQHKNAVDTIKEVVNLLLIKGSIAKEGAGTCPVRGHSNVQGDRTMGIYEKPPQAFLDRIEKAFGFHPPQAHGYDVVDCIHAMHKGDAKVFFAMGGNFLSASPDTDFTAQALQNCDLTVQVSTKLNRSHLVTGKEAIILPCFGRSDSDIINGEHQFVTCENSMGVVQMSKGKLKPVSGDLRSEPQIVIGLAKATLGSKSVIPWDKYATHYDHIRDAIESSIPGFDNYNERAREMGGFYLPNSARDGKWNTMTGKANFNVATSVPVSVADDELMMMTIRSHDQFNTTIYGLNDRYRGVENERRVIFMNPKDIKKLDFEAGELVDLYNFHGDVERIARKFIIISFNIPLGCAATYFPEANILVPIDSVADKSNTPTSKMVILKLRKHG
ncbi:MAG: FdhF/YdeP family oxidoreductase [Bacteroidetes bacterium]|nr:FdhF/YdeP family oxidoreductase [Bacteroidota bacterium]MDA1224873.1 FdhF/YdeP family oxidoreductase [Bacteroidota bacterium]